MSDSENETPAKTPRQRLINSHRSESISPHVTFGDDGLMHELHIGPCGRVEVPEGSVVHDTRIPTLIVQAI